MKSFNKHLSKYKVNLLRFDGERAINSEGFKKYLQNNNITYVP